MTIPRSDRVCTENGWKCSIRNINCVNLKRLRLKRFIPIEHDQRLIKIKIPRLVRVKNYNEYWHAMMFSFCRRVTGILKFLSEIKEIHSVRFSKVVSKERIYTKLSLFKSKNFSKRGFAISRRR